MKSLDKLVELGYDVVTLTFRNNGIKIRRKGYAIMRGGVEMFTIEPKSYPDGSMFSKDKYMLACKGIGGVTYYTHINSVVREIISQS